MARRVFLVGLVVVLLASTVSSASTVGKSSSRPARQQVPALAAPVGASGSSSTALAPAGRVSLPEILYPAAQSLVMAPLRLLRQLAEELVSFLGSHNIRQLLSLQFFQKVVARLPARTATYWSTLVSMESSCAQRTICDLSHYASTILPPWAQQISLIYLNTFSATHPYYQVASQGMTAGHCAKLFDACNPDAFFDRLRGNVTDSLATTVAPLREAFSDLVAVTESTLSSLATDENTNQDDEDRRPSARSGSGRMRN